MSTVRTYPQTRPHRIVTSPGRSRTEPAPAGFFQSVMHHHEPDNFDQGLMVPSQPRKKITQEEQDVEDEEARKRAMSNLVNSWQERLQLISVITTFFASTEAAMLVNTKPLTTGDLANSILQASNASLLGALIVHVYAAVLSFLGAFLLIRYKLKEATREEMIAEGIKMVNSPLGGSMIKDVERSAVDARQQHDGPESPVVHKPANHGAAASAAVQGIRKGSYAVEPPVISKHPHIEQVGPFMSHVSSHLLSRTHALCVFLAAVGFVLAIVGILCYAWALQPMAVSVFASMCLGTAVLAMVALLVPERV